MATLEEVQKKSKDLQSLRDKIAAEESKQSARIQGAEADIAMAQLEEEEQRLTAQLDSLKEANKVSVIRDAVKDQVAVITDGPEVPTADAVTAPEGNK